MRKLSYLLLGMGLWMLPGSLVHADGDLNNSTWVAMEKGKNTSNDHLVFINGQFTSSGCVPYGFVTGSYSSSKEVDTVHWKATQMNSENEKMDWSGEVKGKVMTGSYVYLDKKGKSSTQQWTAKKLEAK